MYGIPDPRIGVYAISVPEYMATLRQFREAEQQASYSFANALFHDQYSQQPVLEAQVIAEEPAPDSRDRERSQQELVRGIRNLTARIESQENLLRTQATAMRTMVAALSEVKTEIRNLRNEVNARIYTGNRG